MYRMGVPKHDAEELVQDVLMKVYLRAGTFSNDGRAKLTTWITQIAKRKAIDFHRVRLRRPKFEDLKNDIVPVDAYGRPASHQITYLERWMDGLEKLPPEDQQILSWRDKGFMYAEIAKWLCIKEATARVRHLRAKRKLDVAANQLEPLEGAPVLEALAIGAGHE